MKNFNPNLIVALIDYTRYFLPLFVDHLDGDLYNNQVIIPFCSGSEAYQTDPGPKLDHEIFSHSDSIGP